MYSGGVAMRSLRASHAHGFATRSLRALRARGFRAAASTPASDEHVEWAELAPARRMAWAALGWNAESWSGARLPPMSELSRRRSADGAPSLSGEAVLGASKI